MNIFRLCLVLIFFEANLISEQKLFFNENFSQQSLFHDEAMYENAQKDPLKFWEKCAEELCWFKRWEQILEWKPPFAKWFLSGTLNVSYNCLDRHIFNGNGDKIALIHINEAGAKQTITYQQLYQEVNRLANVMKSCGVKKGDRVAIYMPMVPEALASLLACTRIGAVHTVIFGGIGPGSVKDRILDAEAKLLITADGSYRNGKIVPYKSAIDNVLNDCPCIENVIVFENIKQPIALKEGRDHWYHQLIAQAAPFCPCEHMDAEDPLFILYTSGTTGKPKGILHTTGGYLVGVHSTFQWVFDIKPEDIYWCTADIGWITGHSYVVYGPMSNGASQVIYEGSFNYPSKTRFTEIIDQNGVSIFYTAPTLIRMFMQWGEDCLAGSNLNSLRLLGSIGEPINPEAWLWFYERIGKKQCPIVDTWFQTETGALVISPMPGITHLKPGSVTKALPGYRVATLDEEGNFSNKGFLAILQPYPSMMRGLYNDHENRFVTTYWSKWNGEYYFTGDIAITDEDHYIWVGGRCDEVLKVAGHRIGTAEVENALVESLYVAESAVIGIHDAIKGEKIVAFVILKDNVKETSDLEKNLQQSVATQLGSYAKPERIVFVQNLPKTRSGKILRRVLKNLIEGKPMGNIATLSDPSVMDELQKVCEKLHREFYLSEKLLLQISSFPEFQPAPLPVHYSSQAIVKAMTPILALHLSSTNYDRLHLAEEFIDECLKNKKSTILETFANFSPTLDIKPYNGGSCYSLTQDLYNRIPKKFHPYLVASTLPPRFKQEGQALISHTAILIPFLNENEEGFVLLDPNFDIAIPIVLKKNGNKFTVNLKKLGEWTFLLHEDKIFCYTDPINPSIPLLEQASMVYFTTQYMNSVAVGLKPMIAADRKISLVSRDTKGNHLIHLNLNLNTNTIVWSIKGEKQPPITFNEFLSGCQFSEKIAHMLHLNEPSLNQSIKKIIEHQIFLNNLNQEYLHALKLSPRKQDFYLK